MTRSLHNTPSRTRVFLILAIGVLAVSTAALFIRLAQGSGAPSLAIAAGRLTIASLIMVPLALVANGASVRALSRADWWRGSVLGALLAAHFWLWIASLGHVGVALSTALAGTVPVWVALGAWAVRGERFSRGQLAGLALAVCGGTALALTSGEGLAGTSRLLGCALAIACAWAIAANMLIGQSLRARVPVRTYAALSYGFAALWLCVAMVVTGTPILGFSTGAYLAMLALALIPQLIGHTAFNWALPFAGATTVAVSVLGEPIGAALLAAALLNEPITVAMTICFVVTLIGIALVAVGKRKATT